MKEKIRRWLKWLELNRRLRPSPNLQRVLCEDANIDEPDNVIPFPDRFARCVHRALNPDKFPVTKDTVFINARGFELRKIKAQNG